MLYSEGHYRALWLIRESAVLAVPPLGRANSPRTLIGRPGGQRRVIGSDDYGSFLRLSRFAAFPLAAGAARKTLTPPLSVLSTLQPPGQQVHVRPGDALQPAQSHLPGQGAGGLQRLRQILQPQRALPDTAARRCVRSTLSPSLCLSGQSVLAQEFACIENVSSEPYR